MVSFCSSNVLWYLHEISDSSGVACVTAKEIAAEFVVAEDCACVQLQLLCEGGFIRLVSPGRYELTECGNDECVFLQRFVSQAKTKKTNPRTAAKNAVKLKDWFPNLPPDEICREMAELTAAARGKKLKCSEEEFELAKKMM